MTRLAISILQKSADLSTRLTDSYCSSTENYDVASFNSTDLHAQNIGAIQYKFIFEVNEDRTPISNPEVFESIRNYNFTRLNWASNSNGDRLTHLDKTYKVEVQGIFQSGQSAINEACYINTPKSADLSTRLTDTYCSSTDNYDVASFNSTNLYAKKIGANQYKFIFTEVNEDRTPISNPEVFESIRKSNFTRLIWASNSSGDRLTHLDKTYKVEVQGIFQSSQSTINEACYINTPKSADLSTRLTDTYCSSTDNYDVASFKSTC